MATIMKEGAKNEIWRQTNFKLVGVLDGEPVFLTNCDHIVVDQSSEALSLQVTNQAYYLADAYGSRIREDLVSFRS